MTADQFRNLVLTFAETEERSHHGHPDFRAKGKIFATVGYPDDTRGMVILAPEQQAEFMHDYPQVFEPAPGAWGRNGSTIVHLPRATQTILKPAVQAAWQKGMQSRPGSGKNTPRAKSAARGKNPKRGKSAAPAKAKA